MIRIVALFTALAVLAAACGADSGDADPAAEPRPSTSSTTPQTTERGDPKPEAPMEELARGFNLAGLALWNEQSATGNLIFSPVSIGHALLMARGAADDATGQAIDAALTLPAGRSAHEAWNAFDQSLPRATGAEEDIVITIADRIWPRIGVTPDPEWVLLLEREHGVTTETLDFAEQPEASREVINDWVSDNTQGLIPDLLPANFIRADTVLVLTDAVYFKARWQRPFGKYGTVTDSFTRLDGSEVETEFMRELELGDRRGVGDGFVAAEIPYVDDEFSMLLIVPDHGRFEEIRSALDADLLATIDTFETGPYELLLPKWEDATTIDLLSWLTSIGAAPGSYPAISPDAFLDAAVHAADVAVDEWGTVAAAATAFGFAESGPPEPELTVAADQPFLYLIRHRSSGMILFAGQVVDPNA